jgi:hypothetical protein
MRVSVRELQIPESGRFNPPMKETVKVGSMSHPLFTTFKIFSTRLSLSTCT